MAEIPDYRQLGKHEFLGLGQLKIACSDGLNPLISVRFCSCLQLAFGQDDIFV